MEDPQPQHLAGADLAHQDRVVGVNRAVDVEKAGGHGDEPRGLESGMDHDLAFPVGALDGVEPEERVLHSIGADAAEEF